MEPSKKVRDAIDRLSEAELQYEIQRGKDSRFSRAIPYMKKRLDEFKDDKEAQKRREDRADGSKARRIQIAILIVLGLSGLVMLAALLHTQ